MNPQVIIRLGSHAEKEYLLKTLRFWDGVIIGANLIEATPAATASLIVRTSGTRHAIPYYIDPMTYAFGTYTIRQSNTVRTDLDWIKSDQKLRDSKQTKRDFKRSYRLLAEEFGGPFVESLKTSRALTPKDISNNSLLEEISTSVVEYQLHRIQRELSESELVEKEDVPKPAAVFAPYFYSEPRDFDAWMDVNLNLATATKKLAPSLPVHAIICIDYKYLTNNLYIDSLKKSIPQTGVSAVWLWFSRFREESATAHELLAFRDLVESLSEKIHVFNLHGGFFSLALAKLGLSGVSHGIGYGEQKDVIPIVGQAMPTVRYYLPDVHKRVGVPDVEHCFDELGIKQPINFHQEVCNCVMCTGVLSQSVYDFGKFGEMHRSNRLAKRDAQTPAAAKRCRFHFLLTRIRERDEQKQRTVNQTREQLQEAFVKWGSLPSMTEEVQHLRHWITALE